MIGYLKGIIKMEDKKERRPSKKNSMRDNRKFPYKKTRKGGNIK